MLGLVPPSLGVRGLRLTYATQQIKLDAILRSLLLTFENWYNSYEQYYFVLTLKGTPIRGRREASTLVQAASHKDKLRKYVIT